MCASYSVVRESSYRYRYQASLRPPAYGRKYVSLPTASDIIDWAQPSFSTQNTYYQPPPPQFGPHDPVKRMMLIPLNVARSVFIFRLPTGARDTHPELKNLGNGLPHVTSFAGGSRRGGRVWYRRPTMTLAQVYAVATDCLDRV